MTHVIKVLAAAVALLLALPATAQTVFVPSRSDIPVLIGALLPNTQYFVTASGIGNIEQSRSLTTTADGRPTYPFAPPYDFFNPNGADFDQTGSGYGVGGAGRNFGALLGTFTATPTGPSDYFLIGLGTSFTNGPAPATLFAMINDSVYNDNAAGSGYTVMLAAAPEPATWGLMILGFGAAGGALRRRRATTAMVKCATH